MSALSLRLPESLHRQLAAAAGRFEAVLDKVRDVAAPDHVAPAEQRRKKRG